MVEVAPERAATDLAGPARSPLKVMVEDGVITSSEIEILDRELSRVEKDLGVTSSPR